MNRQHSWDSQRIPWTEAAHICSENTAPNSTAARGKAAVTVAPEATKGIDSSIQSEGYFTFDFFKFQKIGTDFAMILGCVLWATWLQCLACLLFSQTSRPAFVMEGTGGAIEWWFW